MKNRSLLEKWKADGFSVLLFSLLFVFLILLNLAATEIENRFGWRIDASFNQITTHGEETKNVLALLDEPVEIYAIYRRGEEDAPLMELLNRYAAASSWITWEQVDPALNPAVPARFSTEEAIVSSDSLVIYGPETGRWQVLTAEDFVSLSLDETTGTYTSAGWTYERSITRAIAYVTRDTIPRVLIAQGHGEIEESSLSAFTEWLEGNQYQVDFVDLSDPDTQLNSENLLIFSSPVRELTEEELEKISRFAGGGGSFLFTCDYSDPVSRMTNYSALLRSYGIIPRDGIVVADSDDPAGYASGVRIQIYPEMLSTDLTMDLVATGQNVILLPGARAFETPEETDRNLMTSVVLQSRETAYLKIMDSRTTSMERGAEDPSGPFTLAMTARRVTQEGYVSRAFAVGCSALLTENRLWAMTDTQQMMLRVMEFLLDQRVSSLSIMAKDGLRPALRTEGTGMGSVLVAAMPLGILALALIILLPRRNRR